MYELMNKIPIVLNICSGVKIYSSGNNLIATWELLSKASPHSLTPFHFVYNQSHTETLTLRFEKQQTNLICIPEHAVGSNLSINDISDIHSHQIWENSSDFFDESSVLSSLWFSDTNQVLTISFKLWTDTPSWPFWWPFNTAPPPLSIQWWNMTSSLSLLHSVTPLSPHRLKRRHSNFLSVSHLRIFYDFSCALVLHWPPKISYSASNKGRRSPWRDIAQLSIPLPCQRLSLLSISSSLKCNICHFLCGKKLMQHHNP